MKKKQFKRDFDYYIDEYMYNCRSRKLRPKTMISYEQTLRLFERWCLEEANITEPGQVLESTIRHYICSLQERGKYTFYSAENCAITYNPALATIQTEGGIVQGIGHTLMENVTYDRNGRPAESSFMQYKVPTRLDMGRLKVKFEHSYEPTGPFGAKSIGEIVINTPGPAIAHAIYRATGVWHRELPITPERIALGIEE